MYVSGVENIRTKNKELHTDLVNLTWGWLNEDRFFIFRWSVLLIFRYWGASTWADTYEEMVILVSVSSSIFFRFLPSFPISLPTRLLWARIFRGISSVLRKQDHKTRDVHKEPCEKNNDSDLHLRVICFFLHDVHDHTACGRAAFRCGVNADGLLCGSRILFTVNVHPVRTWIWLAKWMTVLITIIHPNKLNYNTPLV